MPNPRPAVALLLSIPLLASRPALPPASADDVRQADDRTQAKPDGELIQGTWKVVAMVRNGVTTSDQELADDPMSMRFDGETLTLVKGGSRSEAAFRLDPATEPRRITLTPKDGAGKDKARTSIYALKGDTLRIAFRLGPDAANPPADFAHPEGVRLMTLERQKP